jgi:hypothetical protein
MSHPFHVDAPKDADTGNELAIQSRFRSRMKMLAPKVRLFAVPNAGKRSVWEAGRAKAEGLMPGVPDLVALWSNQGIAGVAFLEFKTRTGSISEAQADWLTWLHMADHNVGVFRHPDTALAFLKQCGAPFLIERGFL